MSEGTQLGQESGFLWQRSRGWGVCGVGAWTVSRPQLEAEQGRGRTPGGKSSSKASGGVWVRNRELRALLQWQDLLGGLERGAGRREKASTRGCDRGSRKTLELRPSLLLPLTVELPFHERTRVRAWKGQAGKQA